MDTSCDQVIHDVPPYLRVYKDGTIERLFGTEVAPATFDHQTEVSSKDIVVVPDTGVSVRIYRPTLTHHHQKLPLVVYFHGGAFFISSISDPKYHNVLNILAAEAKVIVVSVDYRRAPEHPLPAAYEDSWAVFQWLASHNSGGGTETWLKENVDFDRFFLAGDSAGANISHHMAIRVGRSGWFLSGTKIDGILMIQPYFWGDEPVGVEARDPIRKGMVDKWWQFVCPSDKGNKDPWINPFVNGAANLAGLACDRILVCTAENDILRDRGRLYYESLLKSQWQGKAEAFETEAEDHVFHLINPTSEKAVKLIKRCAEFINHE
ncbi:probable carboxylesterase 2 [Olea europaea var. sylvestris]|uniref:Probable carboxylesterase 2 n=1 Tax=Olea europaea subsp. europaea TaxID=158383 RepID=A0A8S0RNL5_OLEEU|nr:probable carboxylesterase 2 [Olea europaea var. sylvestris]CAA2981510.1 probable carboxylesterase 2 [Olea europaea subsp. europaea]